MSLEITDLGNGWKRTEKHQVWYAKRTGQNTSLQIIHDGENWVVCPDDYLRLGKFKTAEAAMKWADQA